MAINEVIYGNETLINLKNDTVNENNLLKGATAHDASGNEIEGKVVVADVIDNLDSESSDDALSANMGRLLNEKISNTRLATDLENIDEAGIERIKEIANEEIPDEIVVYDDDYEEETTEVPRDADRLGGQLPSYYSKKSELDAEISRATAAENAINNSLNSLNAKLGELIKTKTIQLTTNANGWIIFPSNETILYGYIDTFYNSLNLKPRLGIGTYTRSYNDANETTTDLSVNTTYNVTYWYI